MSESKNNGQRYDLLYEQLMLRGMAVHEANKKRLRAGLVTLAVMPVLLCIIRALTDSDKVVFLIIWIVFMFAVCAYMIGVEYLDNSVQKTLEEVTRHEISFDELYLGPEQLQERLYERTMERQEMLHERIEESQERMQEMIAARQERVAAIRAKRQELIAELLKHRDAADAAETETAEKEGHDAPESGDEI